MENVIEDDAAKPGHRHRHYLRSPARLGVPVVPPADGVSERSNRESIGVPASARPHKYIQGGLKSMLKISSRQVILIGAMYVLDSSLISVHAQMAWYAKQHIWLSHVIAAAALLLPLWLITKVLARFPDRDLFEAMVIRFPVVGRVIGMSYIVFFMYILSRDLRMTVDFANVSLLPTTPLGVIAALLTLSAIFLAYGGVEILGRATEVYGTLLLIIVALMSTVLFREFDISLAMPFFRFDAQGIFVGSWLVVSYLGEVIAIAFLFSNRTLQFKHVFWALAIGTTALLALAVQSLLTLGIPVMSRMLYPNYELVRQLRLTDFLDRFDLPLVGLWLPTMITKIGYSLFIVCHGIKRMVPNTSGQRFVVPVAFLAMACSFWFFESAMQLFNLNRVWPAVSLIFQWLIPVLLFFLLKPKKSATTPAAAKEG
jgi:spore germination protein